MFISEGVYGVPLKSVISKILAKKSVISKIKGQFHTPTCITECIIQNYFIMYVRDFGSDCISSWLLLISYVIRVKVHVNV